MLIGLIASKTVVEYLGKFENNTWSWKDHVSTYQYVPDKVHSVGTVYNHGMFYPHVPTAPKLFDGNVLVNSTRQRQPGRDFQPYIKTNRRDAMATSGMPNDTLIDADYERHQNDTYNVLDKLDQAYKMRSDCKGDGIKDLGILTRYLDIALRLLIGGSNFDSVCHVIADKMIDDFRSDNFAVNIELPDNNSRSRDGNLTDADKNRFDAYDAAIVWITSKSYGIVKIAVSRIDKALESYQS